jgi:hypothetical protein
MYVRVLLFAAAAACASSLGAQDLTPPKILQLTIETVKVGKAGPHERHETGWPLAFDAAKVPAYYFALTPTIGNRDAIYMSGHESFAAFEALNEATEKAPGLTARLAALAEKDADYLDNVRTVLAAHRPEGSIGRMQGADYSAVRGWRITTTRVRIGFGDEFMEYRRMLKAANERAGVTRASGLYQATQGVNTPTFIVFRPFVSMAEFDADSAINASVRAAMTAEDRKKMDDLYQAAVLTSESATYAVAPRQSHMPASYAASPFWKSNPVFAAAAARATAVQAGAPRERKRTP